MMNREHLALVGGIALNLFALTGGVLKVSELLNTQPKLGRERISGYDYLEQYSVFGAGRDRTLGATHYDIYAQSGVGGYQWGQDYSYTVATPGHWVNTSCESNTYQFRRDR